LIQPVPKRLWSITLLVFLFFFRLGFGLSSPFWTDDEKQIYLIGLKHFTTHSWPYFGPDVAYQIQIPGALQGLLISVPLGLLRIPEAPFILLNLLSFAALCFFAWYCTKRLPNVPAWFIWIWLMTAPWTLNFSTHVVNPSYVLPGAILFFIGFLETFPYTSKQLISRSMAIFMMGVSLFWVMQLHMSWTVLLPYLGVSFFYQLRNHSTSLAKHLGSFLIGSLLTGSLLVPTFATYGFSEGLGGTGSAATLNLANVTRVLNPIEGVVPRFLSLASFELPRFIGNNSASRWLFVKQHIWFSPVIVLLLVIGILQPLAMVVIWFLKEESEKDWRAVKYLTLATIALLCISFLFSLKAPASHTFYLTLPIAMLYSFYCWSKFLIKPLWRKLAVVFVLCGMAFHILLGYQHFKEVSLYINRGIPEAAIEKSDYRIMGERREGAKY